MPALKKEVRQMRIKDVPMDIHRRVVAYQKILAIQKKSDISQDEATIELLRQACDLIPALNQ